MRTLVIIDCGSGNLHSVQAGMRRAAAGRSVEVTVTSDPAALDAADRVVLPGVGAFADCMRGLLALSGMREALERRVLGDGIPFLGICVGMQMLLARSHEHGIHAGLGWLEGEVVPITPRDSTLKIPHMGWNELQIRNQVHPLFSGIHDGDHMYFVHSFYARPEKPEEALATVQYGEVLTAALGKGNVAGVQFHPEKSHKTGERLLANFIEWNP